MSAIRDLGRPDVQWEQPHHQTWKVATTEGLRERRLATMEVARYAILEYRAAPFGIYHDYLGEMALAACMRYFDAVDAERRYLREGEQCQEDTSTVKSGDREIT